MEIRREVELEGTIDDVWSCVTDPDDLATWLDGDLDVDGEGGLEPGTTATFTEPDGTVRHVLVGDVVPDRSVSWTWWTDDEDEPPSEVTVGLEPVVDQPDVVRVIVVERRLVVTASVPRAQARAAALV